MGYVLRTAPSGPVLTAANAQILAYNTATQEWDPVDPPTPGTTPVLPYDYVFTDYASLETQFPAAGGVHTIAPAGTYLLAGPIAVPADIQIVFQGDVSITAMQGAVITGDVDAPLLTTEAEATLWDVSLTNARAGGSSMGWQAATADFDSRSYNLIVDGGQGAVTLTNGDNLLVGGSLVAGFGSLVIEGGGNIELHGVQLSGDACVVLNGGIDRFGVNGGQWKDSNNGMLMFAGMRSLTVDGLQLQDVGTGFLGNSGVGQASFTGVAFSAGTTGIDWAAADIPANGLSVVACALDCATPFANFTAASARVNIKACLGVGALLTETAIV